MFARPAGAIYLDGNSLGLLSQPSEAAVLRALAMWRENAVGGWFHDDGWLTAFSRCVDRLERLTGAEHGEVTLGSSTTVALHQFAATFFQPKPGRDCILVDDTCFPSDSYALRSQLCLHGLSPETNLIRVKAGADGLVEEEAIVRAMQGPVVLAVLSAAIFTTGQLLSIPRLTEAAHAQGILIGFDASHSVGAVPHQLHAWGPDFAIWCGYKYLNGGPGAPSGVFMHRRHFGRSAGLAGWFGSHPERMFEMKPVQSPAPGAAAMGMGTPPVLSLAALDGALEVFDGAPIDELRAKSVELTEWLIALADLKLGAMGFTVASPRDAERRGGHVALRHEHAQEICRRLLQKGIVPDYRPPDIIRLAPAPLYNGWCDCWDAVTAISEIAGS